jgi:hypothetical protein
MPSPIDTCLASARLCSQIARKTRTPDDRSEFLSLAASWRRLAGEIESDERLIALIDGLAASRPPRSEADPTLDEFGDSHLSSLRRLATTVLSASLHFMAAGDSSSDAEELGAARPAVGV